jgi:hypothetical protein
MEFLRALGRFILMQLAILGFLIAAPAILVGVSLFAIAGGAGSNPGFLAFFYMAAGPFVSAVWTMIVLHVRNVYRVRKETGESFKHDFRRHLVVWGYMFYGFFGTAAAEIVFNVAFHAVSKSPVAYFAFAPFVVFSPLLLLCAWSSFT